MSACFSVPVSFLGPRHEVFLFPLLAVRLEIVAFQGCQFERFENWWGEVMGH